jgi:2'-5' RNA ligase
MNDFADDLPPMILTLKIERAAFDLFDKLRRRHFPPERNFIPAHITLFHALPAEQENFVRETLTKIVGATAAFDLNFSAARFLGKGVAVNVESAALIALRADLVKLFNGFLTAQDAQKGYRPHVTIQNKVAPEAARRLFEKFSDEWQPVVFRAEGLLLWQYLGGPWKLIAEYDFN